MGGTRCLGITGRLTMPLADFGGRKMDTPTRNPVPGDMRRTAGSRPAGLYGELPPLPAQPVASTGRTPVAIQGPIARLTGSAPPD